MKGHGRKSISPTTRRPTARMAKATPSYPKKGKKTMRLKGLK